MLSGSSVAGGRLGKVPGNRGDMSPGLDIISTCGVRLQPAGQGMVMKGENGERGGEGELERVATLVREQS